MTERSAEDTSVLPRITLRVGVTGHRPNKLPPGSAERAAAQARGVLACLKEAVATVAAEADWAFDTARAPAFKFISSLAAGADTFMASTAIAAGFDLAAVLPFPRAEYRKDFENPDDLAAYDALLADGVPVLELDDPGDLSDPTRRAAGYLEAGRAVLAHADVLLAVWDGNKEAGIGGTAHIVREAQEYGLLVIWFPTDGGPVKLWSPTPQAIHPAVDGTWLDIDASSDDPAHGAPVLARRVRDMLAPPEGDDRSKQALVDFGREPWRESSNWCGYDALRWLGTRRAFHRKVDYGLARERDGAWADSLAVLKARGDTRFAERLDRVLRHRWLKADNAAVHFSHVYRTAYICNFLLAGLSVLVGLLSVFWWSSVAFKSVCLGFELVCICGILLNVYLGHRRRWHVRWIDYRTIAEALRPARLPAMVGVAPTKPAARAGGYEDAWILWYVRATLREIGLPSVRLDAEALRTTVDLALAEEIGSSERGQIAYHESVKATFEKIDHKLHRLGEYFFWATLGAGVLFFVLMFFGDDEHHSWAYSYKPLATVLGGALPAIGAALFGIRATGDFRAAERQSQRMIRRLTHLRAHLEHARNHPDRALTIQLLAELTQTLAADLSVWSLIYTQRELHLP